MFSHSCTQVFQTLLDHTNSDISFELLKDLLILDSADWNRVSEIFSERFQSVFLTRQSLSPDLIERQWFITRREWLPGFFVKTKDQLIDLLCLAVNMVVGRKDRFQKTCAMVKKCL